jgi:hypothetical protein
MSDEQKQILRLVADLARAAAEWRGGAHEGVAYTDSQWREKLEVIAKRAEALL